MSTQNEALHNFFTSYRKVKNRIFHILAADKRDDKLSRNFVIIISTLIALNMVAAVLQTDESISDQFGNFFNVLEDISVFIFTIEYLLRLWSCSSQPAFSYPLIGRIKFMLKPLVFLDLIAILPYYLPLLVALDLRFLRILRLFRLIRVLKMMRYSFAIRKLTVVIRTKKEELVASCIVLAFLLVIASGLMYFAEREAKPATFQSIPAAMWWAFQTVSMVNFESIQPITFEGKLLGVFIALLGIGLFAIPAGIIAAGFLEHIDQRKQHKELHICPHCKKEIEISRLNEP